MEAATGLVDTALGKLSDLAAEKHELWKGLPGEIEFIEKELRAMKDAISRAHNGAGYWIEDLRDLSYKIENCIDRYNLQVPCEQEAESFFKGLFRSVSSFPALINLAEEIKRIKKRVEEAKQRRQGYDQGGAPVHQHNGNSNIVYDPEPQPKGFDESTRELVELLKKGEGQAKWPRVVTIAGSGGSGKSILAYAAYDGVLKLEKIQHKAWVDTSKLSNVEALLSSILEQFQQPIQSSDCKCLIEQLQKFQQDKRYIVGIDNVQTTSWWPAIESSFLRLPENDQSSRIILTTTNQQIAETYRWNCQIFTMKPLKGNDSRALLMRAFGKNGCPRLDEGRIDLILNKCGDLPLAIVNMATYLRGIESRLNGDEGDRVCKEFGSILVEQEAFAQMKHVLTRTYGDLSHQAKTCLMSLSMYPRDHPIKRKSLIRRWLAERLVVGTNGRPMEEEAAKCFRELMQHHVILPTDFSSSGEVKTCKVQGMMHEFVEHKSSSERFITLIDTENLPAQIGIINRLRLQNSSEARGIARKLHVCDVRSLTFYGTASKSLLDFCAYELLRVLDLENCEKLKDSHLEIVCSLFSLRYLSIRRSTGVSKLPKKIAKLQNLETLDTRETEVVTVPMKVIQLPNLAHLFGRFQIICKKKVEHGKSKQKKLLSQESKLQTLSGFSVDQSPGFVRIMSNMANLRKLKIWCEQMAPGEEIISNLVSSLEKCGSLCSLSINFDVSPLDFLDGLKLRSPGRLRCLKLQGKLNKLPHFILSLDNLKELCLSGGNLEGKVLLVLQKLPLVHLQLVQNRLEFDRGEFIVKEGGFAKLESLCFVVPQLPKISIAQKALQGLRSLQLFCINLGGLSSIQHLTRLEELILDSRVNEKTENDLSEEVCVHSNKPKLSKKEHSHFDV